MHKILPILLFLTCTYELGAQVNVVLEDSISFKTNNYDNFQIDQQNNIYLSYQDVLLKLSSKGDTINIYSNKLLGEISSFDLSLSLKSPVFYRDLGQIVFIDNTLSPMKEIIELDELELEQVTLVCSSQQGGLWLYDAIEFTLIKYDKNMKEVNRSYNLSQMLKKEVNPNKIIERNNNLYMWLDNEILVFDIFGGFIKTLHLDNVFSVLNENVLLTLDDNELILYNMKDSFSDKIDYSNPSNIRHCAIQGKGLYVLDDKGIFVYKIQ